MHLVIVEPSPLAKNMYRLLLQSYAPQVEPILCDRLADLGDRDVDAHYQGILVGGQAFTGEDAEFRALLTDVSAWAKLPKLIIAQEKRTGHACPWEGLANCHVLERPFRPADFAKALAELGVGS